MSYMWGRAKLAVQFLYSFSSLKYFHTCYCYCYFFFSSFFSHSPFSALTSVAHLYRMLKKAPAGSCLLHPCHNKCLYHTWVAPVNPQTFNNNSMNGCRYHVCFDEYKQPITGDLKCDCNKFCDGAQCFPKRCPEKITLVCSILFFSFLL